MLVQILANKSRSWQQLGANNPVVKPSQYINTLKRIAEMAGFKDTEQFFASGEEIDAALAQQAQAQAQDASAGIEQAKLKLRLQLKREKMQAELALEREKMQAELELRRFELEAELQLRQQKLAFGGNVSDNLPRV